MKTLVIYKSNSGFVKKYAEIIQQELDCDVIERSSANVNIMKNYDVIIYGGGLYAVSINGVDIIKNNINDLKEKELIVFCSGATPYREAVYTQVYNKNFDENQRKYIKMFYLRGGFDYNRLKTGHKIIMKLMKWQLSKKKNPTEDDIGMLNAFKESVDFTSLENAQELIDYVRNIRSK